MRDLIVFGVVVLTLPLAFRRPFIGLLVFSWLAYMRPQDLCWGFAREMRLSFFVGLTMIIGWVANEAGRRPFWRRDARTWLMVALLISVTLSLINAKLVDKYVWTGYIEFAKIIVVALFTTGQVDSKARLRWLLWTIALCLGFYGFKGGLFGLLTGGSAILRGPGGMLGDNNDFALALVMNVPLLFYLGQTETNQLAKKFSRVAVILTVFTVLLTHSRGGFLALVVTSLLIAWRSGKLFQAVAALALCASAFFMFAPEHVIERIASIGVSEADSSVSARLRAWKTAFGMIEAHPFLGVGFRNFQANYFAFVAPEFRVGSVFAHVAHNSYLQIWAEGGTIAFAIYLSLLASVYFACRRLRKQVRFRKDLTWAHSYARMMEATTAGFIVGAFFLNRGHFDLLYHWMALMSALVFVTGVELRKDPFVERSGVPQPSQVTVDWRPAVLGPGRLPRWGRSP